MEAICCAHCQQLFTPNPRVKNQRYCSHATCQRARKTLWQKQKLETDLDYKSNQKDSQKHWRENNPAYWHQWRTKHPAYIKKNRIRQQARNRRRILKIAKMDALESSNILKSGHYFIIPDPPGAAIIAKMDASIQKVRLIFDS